MSEITEVTVTLLDAEFDEEIETIAKLVISYTTGGKGKKQKVKLNPIRLQIGESHTVYLGG